jgi:hypothetical protein
LSLSVGSPPVALSGAASFVLRLIAERTREVLAYRRWIRDKCAQISREIG